MDRKNVAAYRHRQSPSSDRFIGVFSPPQYDGAISPSPSAVAGDELDEVDVFYTSDSPDPPRSGGASSHAPNHRFGNSFRRSEKFSGILAALPEDHRNLDFVVVQKPVSPAPAIPKPQSTAEMRYSQSVPIRRLQQSAPVRVPVMMARKARMGEFGDVDLGDDVDEEEVLPPHEIVARGSLRNQNGTFSVLEGVGRTLKGRDLRQVRNAVLRQTGFLD